MASTTLTQQEIFEVVRWYQANCTPVGIARALHLPSKEVAKVAKQFYFDQYGSFQKFVDRSPTGPALSVPLPVTGFVPRVQKPRANKRLERNIKYKNLDALCAVAQRELEKFVENERVWDEVLTLLQ